MIMKQLFRHTTSLLRTALLFGAAALFNVLPTQAMTEAELAEMLNPFETKNPTIGDGEYYYIQFYYNGVISYLTDRGADKRASTADFMPSNNRLWTLVDAGDGDASHFMLKSKAGHYIGCAKFESASGNRYGCVESVDDSRITKFELTTDGDGYCIYDLINYYNSNPKNGNGFLGRSRDNNNNIIEWSDQLSVQRNNSSGKQNSRMSS